MVNLKVTECEANSYLSSKEYFELVKICDKSLHLTKKENRLLLNGAVPRFLAGIPYLSNETHPDLLACMNLNAYIACSRNGDFFSTRPGESIKDRIEPYIHSVNGDKQVIALCKIFLEEVSLYDHKNDLLEDIKTGHSNPIVDGIIDFNTEKKKINRRIREYPKAIQKLVEDSFEGKKLGKYWRY